MGGQKSTLKNSQIYVKMDAVEYFSGDKVSGKIALILESEIKDPKLFLTFIGKEFVKFKSNQAQFLNMNSETTGKRVIISKRIAIPLRVNEPLRAGQYLFPITFDLPQKLPGSFHSPEGSLFYQIGAILENKGTVVLSIKEDLAIRELVKDMRFDVNFSEEKFMKNFFLADQGLCKLNFKLQKNAYAGGEYFNGLLFLDCSSLLQAVKVVVVRVHQDIEYSSSASGTKGNYKKIIYAQQFDGLMPGGVREYPITFPIPPNELPTTSGTLIKCNYSVEIKAKVKGLRLFGKSPRLMIPITIFSKPNALPIVQPPPNWNPVMMPVFTGHIEEGIPIQEIVVNDFPEYNNSSNYSSQLQQNANGGGLQEAKMEPPNQFFRNFK